MASAYRVVVLTVAVVLGVLTAREAWAGAPTDQLRSQIDRVLKVLADGEGGGQPRLAERRAAIRAIANEIFDFTETTRRCLGRHWQGRTAEERQQAVELFADLLERSYIGKIELYSGEKIHYLGDTIEGDQATVRTRLQTRQGTEIPVDYRMHRNGDRWLAYDVSIEGVSLVANYRAQFNKIIQASSFKQLLVKLQAKQAESLDGGTVKRASEQ